MRFVKIPKKKRGEFRSIAVPNKREKKELKTFLPYLAFLCKKHCDPEIVHGFSEDRNVVTNASYHTGKQFTLVIDLKDFFNTVKISHIFEYLDDKDVLFPHLNNNKCERKLTIDEFLSKVFIPDENGVLRTWQGLNTSPMLANLAAVKMDREIKECCDTIGVVYTRYADDLTFSFDDYSCYAQLKAEIPKIILKNEFEVNPKKIYLQSSNYGRKVTGVNIYDNGRMGISRKIRNRIRVLRYKMKKYEEYITLCQEKFKCLPESEQRKRIDKDLEGLQKYNLPPKDPSILKCQLKGLEEWSKLKIPVQPPERTIMILRKLLEHLRIKALMTSRDYIDPKTYNPYKVDLEELDRVEKNIKNGLGNFCYDSLGHKQSKKNYDIRTLIRSLYNKKILTKSMIRHMHETVRKLK